jgi:hypothetical protein
MSEKNRDPKIQGEGDYESARRYRKDVERFVAETTRRSWPGRPRRTASRKLTRCSMRSAKVAHDQRSAKPEDTQKEAIDDWNLGHKSSPGDLL